MSSELTTRLMLGDCLERMKEIEDGSLDMVLTDLPYATTQNAWDTLIPMDQLWAAWKRVCKPGAPIVLFTQQPFTTTVAASNLKQLKTEWIWFKSHSTGFLNAKKYPLKIHENILVFCDRTPPYHPQMIACEPFATHRGASTGKKKQGGCYGDRFEQPLVKATERYPSSIIYSASCARHESQHPTQKPVALLENLIKTYSLPGMTVLDCTMGSGSTGVAALNTGRKFIGIEKDESYFAIAEERIAALSTEEQQAA